MAIFHSYVKLPEGILQFHQTGQFVNPQMDVFMGKSWNILWDVLLPCLITEGYITQNHVEIYITQQNHIEG